MEKKSSNEIVVLGNIIQTKIEEVDIFSLHFWKDNPRVNSVIKQKFGEKDFISDEEIEKLLWDLDIPKDLQLDIERNGGLIDEILVKGDIVLEGNSRLCAYRYLYNKAQKNKDINGIAKWSKIRSRIIPENTSNEVIFSILGTWHIKGKKEWDTYEKASYLKKMHADYGYDLKKIAESISESEKFVKDHIKAYEMMVENEVYDLPKFSYFYELVKNKRISEHVQKDPRVIIKTIEAIKANKFKKAEQIRDLPKVLDDKVAKREFIEKGSCFEDAFETTKDRHPEHEDPFYSHIKKTTQLLEHCTVERIEEIKADPNKKYFLKQLHKASEKVCKRSDII